MEDTIDSNEKGDGKTKEDFPLTLSDVSEMDGAPSLDAEGPKRAQVARKDEIVHSLKAINDGTYKTPDGYRIKRLMEEYTRVDPDGQELDDQDLEEIGVAAEKYIISTRVRVLIISVFLLGGAIAITHYFNMKRNKRLKAACELLQKGQPLPDSPDEVQMPNADSLYKLVETCEQDHEVDITYGCAAEGVLHTAGLKHEPSEISEDIKAEALRIAKEIKCNR